MQPQTIALITDFGSSNYYAAIMKGVIYSINPEIHVVDLEHRVQAQSVLQGAFLLYTSYMHFPKGSIFVTVIDPKVGTDRKILCVKANDRYFIAPDNGVLTYILAEPNVQGIVNVTNKEYFLDEVSYTFHGRDIFSPIAAHLSKGLDFKKLGEEIPLSEVVRLSDIKCNYDSTGMLHAEIIYIDGFGNLITTANKDALGISNNPRTKEEWHVIIGKREIKGIRDTFASVKSGEFVAYFGSSNFLEIAVRDWNASEVLNAYLGMEVKIFKKA